MIRENIMYNTCHLKEKESEIANQCLVDHLHERRQVKPQTCYTALNQRILLLPCGKHRFHKRIFALHKSIHNPICQIIA